MDRDFEIEVMRIQMMQSRKVALYGAYFSVGAAFEVFSISLMLTALLLDRSLSPYWFVLMIMYLGTGIGFVAFGVWGFAKLKRTEEKELELLKKRFVS